MQKDPIVAHVTELFALGKMISATEIKAGKVSPLFLFAIRRLTEFDRILCL